METNTHIEVNPEVLTWAREMLNMTRNHAAETSGISVRRLAQLESGKKQPALEELKTLSKTYKRTIATLLLNQAPKEKPLPKDRRTVNSKELGNFHEKTILAVRKAHALAQSYLELRQEMGLETPAFNLYASLTDNPQQTAQQIRQQLNLQEVREIDNINHALDAYIQKVESSGVAVFQLTLTQDSLRGFSIVDDVMPIIGIKRGSEAAHSKIFTLFHELGHIMLNKSGLCDLSEHSEIETEKWCNAFAAEVLVPAPELLQKEIVKKYEQRGEKIWAKKDLIELGNQFHVGPLAILRALLENKLTTSSYYKEKHASWNKPQFGRAKHPEGRNIAKETIKEKGRSYISLAFTAFDQNRINLKDLSDFLGVKLSYIQRTRELLNT